MKTRALVLLLGLVVVAAPAVAADMDGKWTGSIDTPHGAVQVGFTFKAAGKALTGSSTAPDGRETAIKGGKIDGDKISFSLDVDFGGMTFTFSYTGVVSADHINLTAI